MHWTFRAKKNATIIALLIVLMTTGIVLANCHGPSPVTPPSTAAATTTATGTSSARTATPTVPRTSTPSLPPPVTTPVLRPTSTYIATAWPATWTAIPTATMAPTATIATNPATVSPPPISPITGHPTASDGVPLAQLVAITAGVVMLWLAMYGRFRRRR